MNKGYISVGNFELEEVLPYIGKVKEKEYAGHMIRLTSRRYKVFAEKGTVCVKCGIKGKFFSLEKHSNDTKSKLHFNLYAVGPKGPVLMTKDHIVPKAKGGADTIDNLQPMCSHCNMKKADN
jgi:5-methylcytosine-specific restriction endonuclease McrA